MLRSGHNLLAPSTGAKIINMHIHSIFLSCSRAQALKPKTSVTVGNKAEKKPGAEASAGDSEEQIFHAYTDQGVPAPESRWPQQQLLQLKYSDKV